MKETLIAALLALGAVSVSGCGTVCNFAGGFSHPDTEPRIYGGVLNDLEVIDKVVSGPPMQLGHDPRGGVLLLLLGVADPLLSFVADTLTLPITVFIQERRLAASKREHTTTDLATPKALLEKPRPIDETGESQNPR